MNDVISLLGLAAWKPVITALVLPPVPLLLLVLIGTRLVLSRRGLGWLLVLVATVALWLSACTGVAELLSRTVFKAPPALSAAQVAQLRVDAKARPGTMAIVVLGGGRDQMAPEYGSADLRARSLERLRYGLWLQRETGVPVAFSGGVGWSASGGGIAEAEIAERIAVREFGLALKWAENDSRDTRENALRSVPLLERSGIRRIVLVTHGWHMQRALAHFEAAAAGRVEIVPASMGMARQAFGRAVDWLPTPEGFSAVNVLLREALGRLAARGG